jgi:hypothetical protein
MIPNLADFYNYLLGYKVYTKMYTISVDMSDLAESPSPS